MEQGAHSELSQKLDRRGVNGSHIWDHVMHEIETDCYIGDDDLVYTNNRKYMFRASECPIEGLYVHPKTGLIREQPYAVIRKRYRKSS